MIFECLRFLGQILLYSVTCVLSSFIICFALKLILGIFVGVFFANPTNKDDE